MKILIVSQYFWPENFRINELTRELVARGHEVTVLTGVPNYPAGKVFAEYKVDRSRFIEYEGARVVRVPMLSRGTGPVRLVLNYLSFVIGACLFSPWKLRRDRPDVIFVFEPSPITVGIPALLLGRIKKVPVTFWVLDLWPETLAAIGVVRSPRLLAAVGKMVRFIYDRCTLVLGQSRAFVPAIAKYCSDSSKIRYFPNWVEEVYLEACARPAPEVPTAHAGVFSIVFAGNIGEAQDLPAVLDAAQQLGASDGVRWIVVGDGRKFAWLYDEVQRRGLQDRVFLPGRFPAERMPSFFAHADALLVPLKRDPVFSMTIPGKVQSYLMTGIPVVGMLDGEGARVIEAAGAGLAGPAGDADALVRNIRKLIGMTREERQEVGRNGRTYAQREFGREMLIGRLEDMLGESIARYRSSEASI